MSNKKTRAYTHEEFIRQLKLQHSDRYTFDGVVYEGAKNKITVTCNVHGDFEVYPSQFLHSEEIFGCKLCRQEKRQSNSRNTEDKKTKPFRGSFQKISEKSHYGKYDYSQTVYTGKEIYVEVICKAHGPFKAHVQKHRQGKSPCPVCLKNRKKLGKKIADNEYQELCELNRKKVI